MEEANMKSPKFSFIILTYNRSKMLECCLLALHDKIYYKNNCEFIIGNNGSTDNTLAVIESFNPQKIINSKKNIGWNLYKDIFESATGEYIVEIDDDVLEFPEHFDKLFEDYLNTFTDFGLLGLDVIRNEYTNGAKPPEEEYNELTCNGKVLQEGKVGGWCLCIKRDVYNQIGGLGNSNLNTPFFEDGILNNKVKEAGFRTGILKEIKCFHANGLYYSKQYGYLDRDIEKYKIAGFNSGFESYYEKKLAGNQNANEMLSYAIELYNEGNYRKSLTILDEINSLLGNILTKDGHHGIFAEIFNFMGLNYLSLDNIENASDNFGKALRLNDKSSTAYLGLGEIFFRKENYKESEANYKLSLEYNPDNKAGVDGLKKVKMFMNNRSKIFSISSRTELGFLLNSLNLLEHGAIVGLQNGNFSQKMRSTWNGKYLHLIDDWKSNLSIREDSYLTDGQQKQLYHHIISAFTDDSNAFVYKMNSLFAVNQFPESFFDWIYLETDNTYDSCIANLKAWCPKLKTGGIIAVYNSIENCSEQDRSGTKTAIEEFVKDRDSELFFTDSDNTYFWYFIKPIENEIPIEANHDFIINNNITITNSGVTMNNFNDLFLEAFNYYKTGTYGSVIIKLNEAENVYSETEENNFSLEDLYVLRGGTYFVNNEYEQAKQDFENALKSNPNSSEACLGLGQYFSATDQLESAKTMFEWAVKNNVEHLGARKALENINTRLGFPADHNSLAIVESPYIPASKQGPLDEAAQLFSEKKYDAAITMLLGARKEQEEILGSIENFIAFNYLELDNTEGAKYAADRALRLNPFSSQAYATLGEVYYRSKDYYSAKKMYEISLMHNAENNFAKTGLQNANDALSLPGGNGKVNNQNLTHF
jgi:Tfp pilus assembly protein PilF